ncbi:MAG TPA: ABC transporter ATP-binding protein [Cellulomonas sp.]
MLEVNGLRKRFGEVLALDGLDLSVEAGEVVGLVGHNGAGKTTAVGVMLGLVRPDAGSVRVGGIDALAYPRRARALTGVAAQDLQLYVTATVRQNVSLCAGLAGTEHSGLSGLSGHGSRAARRARVRADVDQVLDEVGLAGLADRRVAVLSGGQRRRVQAACALLGSPPLLLLDEPTVGADPQTRSALLAAVRRRADEGAAVLYTTHYLPELVELGATIAVARAGRVVARGTQAVLLAELPARVVATFDEEAPDVLSRLGAERDGDAWVIRTRDPGLVLAELIRAGARPRRVDVQQPSLDDLFAALDREVRDAA